MNNFTANNIVFNNATFSIDGNITKAFYIKTWPRYLPEISVFNSLKMIPGVKIFYTIIPYERTVANASIERNFKDANIKVKGTNDQLVKDEYMTEAEIWRSMKRRMLSGQSEFYRLSIIIHLTANSKEDLKEA